MTAAEAVPSLQSWQRRMVTVAWITYAAYYLGRFNISTAIPDLQASLALTRGQVGLITSGFFWAYALGQLINGPLGDRVSPRRFVFVGMLASAALNLLFGSLSVLPALILVWALNGYFQATGWGPTLRTLANWLTSAQRIRISGVFGSSFVVGNAATWILSGWLVANYGWRMAFWVPAGLLTLIALSWYLLARDTPEAAGHPPVHPAAGISRKLSPTGFAAALVASVQRNWPIVVASVFLGFAFASLIVWLPTYYVEVDHFNIGLASTVSTLVPLSGVFGTLIIGWAVGQFWVGKEARGLSLALLVLAALFVAYPFLPQNIVIESLALAVIGTIAYGATSVLLTTLPLVLGGREAASSTAGLLDLAFNVGAGLSGAVVGSILDNSGWTVMFIVLGGAALMAVVFLAGIPRTAPV